MPVLNIFKGIFQFQTYATDAQVTDSAASATAFMCGEKNKIGVLGLNQKVQRGDCNNTMANRMESFLTKSVNAGEVLSLCHL